MGELAEKKLKISSFDWTAICTGAILLALFAMFPNTAGAQTPVRAETSVEAGPQDRVALESELGRLKAENKALTGELADVRRKLIETIDVYSRQSDS
jgi:hypothetical protein